MLRDMIYIFEANTDKELYVSMSYGPRAVARALGNVFNADKEDWEPRHMGKVALLIADYTAGEKVHEALIRELKIADLQVVFLAH